MMTLGESLGENCPSGFENLPVVYENDWCDHEESGWVVAFDFLGELFVLEGGHCVMGAGDEFCFDPEPITRDGLEALKAVWESIEQTGDP